MIALAVLLVVVVAVAAYGSTRFRHSATTATGSDSGMADGPARWAAAGLVTEEQARAKVVRPVE